MLPWCYCVSLLCIHERCSHDPAMLIWSGSELPKLYLLCSSHVDNNKQELLATELLGHSFGTGGAIILMESACVNLALLRASSSAAAVKILEADELGVPKECNKAIMRQYDALHAVCAGKRSCTPETDVSLWESLHKTLEREDHTALMGLVGVIDPEIALCCMLSHYRCVPWESRIHTT